jgi:hypothetical protein
MNSSEAKTILLERLERYREWPYASLVGRIGAVEAEEVKGPSGTTYQLEFQALWDDKPGGNVRMMGLIDDGGLRAFLPLCDDVIKAPDGRFVGE